MTELVVVLRGDGAAADRHRTIESLTSNTPQLELRIYDPAEVDSGPTAWDVVQSAPNADVVFLDVGTAVGPGWVEQLRAAAYADTIVATASAVPADILSLAEPPSEWPAVTVREAALGEPLWGCVYVRRDALELALRARQVPSDARLEEVVLVPGLVHVLAGAVVLPARDASRRLGATPAVRRALAEVEAQVERLRVTVDLRCCAQAISGTPVHALNLVSALAARDAVSLSVLLPALVHPSLRPHVDALPPSVRRYVEGTPVVPSPHVFHRPYQVFELEVADVVSPGVRLVITHQDMILDRAPAYFNSFEHWLGHPAASALSFVAADEVVFYSEHARREAVREGLIDEAKTSVIPPGTNHLEDGGDETMPAGLHPARPFVLVIGNAYMHKNRLFALRVVDELRRAHRWDGAVVFAGGQPMPGSSRREEEEFLRSRGELSERVVDLGHVSDAARNWLYRRAALVLYPSLYEGFGLIPFEAAAAGTPCVYASRSSVAEYLPPAGALLELGDIEETVLRLHALLESLEARNEIVDHIRVAGGRLTWSRAADAYVQVYRRAMTRPIGLSLVLGPEVVVGARSQVVTSDTERRVLLVLRRSAGARVASSAVLGVAVRARRLVRHFARRRA